MSRPRRKTRAHRNPRRRKVDVGGILTNVAWVGLAGLGIFLVYELVSEWINNPPAYPGGGQVPGTSETYTGAATQTILHPWDTLVTLFGGTPSTQSDLYYGPNSPNAPTPPPVVAPVQALPEATVPPSLYPGFVW